MTALHEAFAEAWHDGYVHQYGECDHGTYSGGPKDGQPFKMCEIQARLMIDALGIKPADAHLARDPGNQGLIVEWDGNEDHGDDPVLIETWRIGATEPESVRKALLGEVCA